MFGAYGIIVISTILIFGSIFGLNFQTANAELCFAPTCTTGNFYIANHNDGTVKLFDSAGGPPINSDWAVDAADDSDGDAYFVLPTTPSHTKAVAIDSSGNVYVGYGGSHNVVLKFDSAGNLLNPIPFAGTLPTLGSIAIDSADNIYVSYTAAGHAAVLKFDSTGTRIPPLPDPPFIPGGTIGNPIYLEFDSAGVLHVLDAGVCKCVRTFDSSTGNQINPSLITGLSTFPESIAFDSTGNIYVSERSQVTQFDSAGTNPVIYAASMIFARGITFDSDGLLYITEANSGWNTVRQYPASGTLPLVPLDSSFATGLSHPRDIAFTTMQAPVGSISIPLESTSILVAGSEMVPVWITLVIATAIGIGIALITKRVKN